MDKLCKDEIAKAAVQAEWTTGVIKLVGGDEKQKQYHIVTFENGDVIITYKPSSMCSNVSYCGNDMDGKLKDPESGLPLKSALNWKKMEEKRDECLEAIKTAVNLSTDLTLEFDKAEFVEHCGKAGYADRPGDVLQYIIDGLKGNMTKICKEEMTQEAIQEEWTTGVLKLVGGDEKQKSYHVCSFDNGDLVITYKPSSMCSNVSYCGNDIEKLL